MQERLTETAFGQYMMGDPSLDTQLAKDINSLAQCATVGAGSLALVVTLPSFVTDEVNVLDRGEKSLSDQQATQNDQRLSVPQPVGNAIDGAMIFFDPIGLIMSWPLAHKHNQNLHWTVSHQSPQHHFLAHAYRCGVLMSVTPCS